MVNKPSVLGAGPCHRQTTSSPGGVVSACGPTRCRLGASWAGNRFLVSRAREKGCGGLLVVRSEMGLSEYGESVLDRLGPSIRSDVQTSEWPGTRTFDVHRVVTFELNDVTTTLLLRTVPGLFGWRQPELPEDLCFLMPNGEPWLTSVAHENLVWVTAERNEVEELRSVGFSTDPHGQ